ncbi:LacI family DNA-binding transcriptional regulator [Paenibacillus tengchongensis]|uniref:LacI family DNA-binding transcriptional regulator n=1 Tax=Paenibacillus tengchongensis TaxID=2608684 RepID=UPI00124F04E0|nr:LacI family DNA-binding transcriptional regulator [Paenibacillus tengchongensis]
MKVTISDVAKAANVAKSTVSKVLNDSPKISAGTKRKVRDIMKELNYIPSSMATGLAKRSSNTVGLLVDLSKQSEFLNQFFYSIIGGIESVIGPMGYELTLFNVQHSDSKDHFLNRLVRSGRVDGLIANNSVLTDELSHTLNELDFPYISIGEIHAPGSWVDFDNEAGGRMLISHLLKRGYRRPAFIGGEKNERIFTRRLAGYLQGLQQAGIPVCEDWIINVEANEHEGYRSALQLLQHIERPDSIVCMTSYSAFGAIKAARELGVDVPVQLGVASFDEYPLSPYTTPPLTSLNIDTFRLGESSGRWLMERIQSGQAEARQLLLQPDLIERASTAGLGL